MQTNSNTEKFQKVARFGYSEIERTQQGKKLNKQKHTKKHQWQEVE